MAKMLPSLKAAATVELLAEAMPISAAYVDRVLIQEKLLGKYIIATIRAMLLDIELLVACVDDWRMIISKTATIKEM